MREKIDFLLIICLLVFLILFFKGMRGELREDYSRVVEILKTIKPDQTHFKLVERDLSKAFFIPEAYCGKNEDSIFKVFFSNKGSFTFKRKLKKDSKQKVQRGRGLWRIDRSQISLEVLEPIPLKGILYSKKVHLNADLRIEKLVFSEMDLSLNFCQSLSKNF